MVADCYCPPSATYFLLSLSNALATHSDFVLSGNLNWDLLKLPDSVIHQFDSPNVFQLILYQPWSRKLSKSFFDRCDFNKWSAYVLCRSGVSFNDSSDLCFIVCICEGQRFFSVTSQKSIGAELTLPLEWRMQDHCLHYFCAVIDNHALIKQIWIKQCFSPWFSPDSAT